MATPRCNPELGMVQRTQVTSPGREEAHRWGLAPPNHRSPGGRGEITKELSRGRGGKPRAHSTPAPCLNHPVSGVRLVSTTQQRLPEQRHILKCFFSIHFTTTCYPSTPRKKSHCLLNTPNKLATSKVIPAQTAHLLMTPPCLYGSHAPQHTTVITQGEWKANQLQRESANPAKDAGFYDIGESDAGEPQLGARQSCKQMKTQESLAHNESEESPGRPHKKFQRNFSDHQRVHKKPETGSRGFAK